MLANAPSKSARAFSNGVLTFTQGHSWVMPIILLTLVVYGLLSAWVWPYTLDDAFISFRYAKHIGEGLGPIWNLADAASPVEGFTSFLHVWLLGGLHFVTGADVVLTGKLLGVVAGLALLVGVAREVHRYGLSGLAALVAFSVFLLPFTTLNAVSGMETALYMLWYFLAAITCVRLLDTPTKRTTWLFVLSGLLGTLTRPEFALPFLIMFGYLWWQRPAIRPTLLQAGLALYIVPGLAITAWRYSFYGDIVPNPFHVKQDTDLNRWGINAVGFFLGYCAMPYLILAAARWRYLWHSHRSLLVVAALNLGIAAVYFSTTLPLMNLAYRYLLPQVPLLALLAAVSLQDRPETLVRTPLTLLTMLGLGLMTLLVLAPIPIIFLIVPKVDWWFQYLLPVMPLLAFLAVIAALSSRSVIRLSTSFAQTAGAVMLLLIILAPLPLVMWMLPVQQEHEARYREVGHRLRPFAAPDRWLVFYDVGALVYEAEWNTVDVVGLNTRKENIQPTCVMKTDIVLTYAWQKSEDAPNPCPGTYTPNADLPFAKNAFIDTYMRVYVRNDASYADELRESLLANWPGAFVRETNWLSWYWANFDWFLLSEITD